MPDVQARESAQGCPTPGAGLGGHVTTTSADAAQKKAIAEREAAQKAHDKMIKEKLAAGWTRRGAFLSPPPTDPATPRPATHAPKPERVKITETEEWQADWRARNAGRTKLRQETGTLTGAGNPGVAWVTRYERCRMKARDGPRS